MDRRIGWILLVASAPAALRAELVYFRQGGRVQAAAETSADGSIRLSLPDGPQTFARGDLRKLVPGYTPAADWPGRSGAARQGGAQDRFAAAWWALQNGLVPEAEGFWREAHAADTGHVATARVCAALDRLDRSCAEPDLEDIRRALPPTGPFEAACSPHVVLLHQRSAARAAERLELLESIVRSYYMLFAAEGLELPVPGRRLVAAWFADRRDYLAFLHAEGADAFRGTLGYYHPTLGLVVTHDTHGRIAPDAGPDRVGSLLREMDRSAFELGTAAHEMIHLLVAASGLAPRPDSFPLWLHEGLAAQFEVVRGGRWAGIGRAHDLRLPDWRRIDPAPRLVPLLRDAGFGHGYRRDAYAAAWALVYYLRKSHPDRFTTFLDLLRSPDAEVRPAADRTVALFRAAFGDDLQGLEADWHRMMATVKTPLEERK
jgi:hypothetical protein